MNFEVTFSSPTQVFEPGLADLMYYPVPGESGITPHIGENNHWWIGQTDTGVKAAVTVTTIDPAEILDTIGQLTNKLGDLPAGQTVAQAIAAALEAAAYDDTELSEAVRTLNGNAQQPGSVAHTASQKISAHNVSEEAHNDIRLLLQGLTIRLNALANSDDTTLDQMAEVVAYIQSNRDLIGQITTGKVSTADVINNLNTNATNKPLSARQGVVLKSLIDAIAIPEIDAALTTRGKAADAKAVGEALAGKVDAENGKGLSSNDYTTADKTKLTGIESGAQVNPSALKNPNPLTINGQSYDGSAPVSINMLGGTMPTFADSIEDMTDQEKAYVLTTDGMIYLYREKTTIVKHNAYDPATAQFNKRISSSGAVSDRNGCLLLPYEEVNLTDPYMVKITGMPLVNNYGAYIYFDIYDANHTRIEQLSGGTGVFPNHEYSNFDLYDLIDSNGTDPGNVKYVRMRLGITESTAISAADCENLVVEFVPKSGTVTTLGWASTGMAYAPADYEDRIIHCEDIDIDHERRIQTLESGSTAEPSYPAYWDCAVEACISKIQALQVGRDCITFPFFSDNHQRLGYAGALIAKVMQECHIPYCLYGGDSISSGHIASEAAMVEEDRKFDAMMKVIPNGRFCRTVGNHDGYWTVSESESHAYTNEQIYELLFREASVSQQKHFGGNGTYYYVDDIASKTRFVILNSNGGFGKAQRNWVQNTALQFFESGWSVVFVSHAPVTNNFHSGISDAQTMQSLLRAYINSSSANKADVVGWFSGHIHQDRIYQCDATGNADADDQTTVDLPWKTVTITSDHTGIAYDDTTRHIVAEDHQSHAIDFVTVNKNTRTVNLTRLGIGSDRSYLY